MSNGAISGAVANGASPIDMLRGSGVIAFAGATISVAFCFGQVLISLLAPLFGLAPFDFNTHLQAIFMWGFGLLTVAGLYRDVSRHRSLVPLLTGITAVLIIAGTLYIHYNVLILIVGYVLLFVSALINQIILLRTLTHKVTALNTNLEQQVEAQVGEIERLARLKRFLPADVADLITSEGNEALLDSHRRQVACLFGDVRNFTAFSEAVEPEDVMNLLQTVHDRMGKIIADHGGTICYRAGDGIMVVFNDPLPRENPVLDAVRLAIDMRQAFSDAEAKWRMLGHNVGFGIGIAFGYATLGLIGSESRYDYTAIGNVINIAARLSDRATAGQILIDKRGLLETDGAIDARSVGQLELKGVTQTVEAHEVLGLTAG